ncbi:MAG TPA: zinc ribbon domain-containing protein [bacterium]|nr:zinc ribbon domain-containing protein [bacterium]HQL63311.1 zinc ribbon domain-containing protein [bacterium]
MPTYEYRCKECGRIIEVFQSMTEKPLKYIESNGECPERKKKCPVERLIGAGAGIIFKGSGFYETDYRKKEYRGKAREESKPTGSSTKDLSAGKSESTAKSKGEKKS